MNQMGFLLWHYTKGLSRAFENFSLLIDSVFHNFSFFILVKSLLSPWKRMVVEDTQPGFNIGRFFENLSFNLISRGIGFCVRVTLLFTGVLATVLATIVGLLMILFWVFVPIVGIPFYLKYVKRHDLFIEKLKGGLAKKGINQIEALLDNEAGRFLCKHLNVSCNALVDNAVKGFRIENVSDAVSFEDLIVKFLQGKVWTEDFLRSKLTAKEDFILGASWWDKKKKDATMKDTSMFFKRPSIGLEILYGYTPYLNQYSYDLATPQSFSHHLVGREKIVGVIERTLSSGNSVALVGHPGVGKRTVILEFARRAAYGQLGPEMSFRRILEFDYNSLLAGSGDVNDKKVKLKAVCTEAARAGNVLLVLRDIHRLTNPQVEGYDFTDVFEEFMEKKELKIIAILTITDYERFVRPNLRLTKFLEKIEVIAPSKDEALLILRDYADEWEVKQKMTITVQSLRKVLEGSDKYITDAPFPQKAMDILDSVIEYEKKEGKNIVLVDDVNAILSEKTGISFARLTEREKDVLANLEDIIHKRLVNQESAISLIAKSIRSRVVGVGKDDKPIGSFLFLGPTGVGKTETAKVLSKIYYGGEDAILRFDMAQYSSSDSLERLIGSVVSGRPGDLSTAIKNRPASLLLLDEIEKASRDVHNLLLTILDEGYIVDSFGKRVSCRHLFIIGTSNAAAEYTRELVKKGVRGDILQKSIVEFCLKKNLFYPEFLNRFDGVVVYEPLAVEHLIKISRLMFEDLKVNLNKKGINLEITDEIVEKVARDGYDPAFGARPMRRIIDLVLGDILGRAIITGKIKEGNVIKLLPDKQKEYSWEKIA